MTFLSEECPKAGKVMIPLVQRCSSLKNAAKGEDTDQKRLWELANQLFYMTSIREESSWLCPLETTPALVHGALFGFNMMNSLGNKGDPVNDLLVYPSNNLFSFIADMPKEPLSLQMLFPQIYDFRSKESSLSLLNSEYFDPGHMPRSISESYLFLNEKDCLITKYPESKIDSIKMTQLFLESGVPCHQLPFSEEKISTDLLLLNSSTCLKWLNSLNDSYKKHRVQLRVLFEKNDHESILFNPVSSQATPLPFD